jgi:hypothetical protein
MNHRGATGLAVVALTACLFPGCGGGDQTAAAEPTSGGARHRAHLDTPLRSDEGLDAPLPTSAVDRELQVIEVSLADALAAAQEDATHPTFLSPTGNEMRRFEDVVVALVGAARGAAGAPASEAAPEAPHGLPPSYHDVARWNHTLAQLGFELALLEGGQLLLIAELEGIRRGGGAYVLRTRMRRPGGALVIQAPHCFFDQDTGRIARRLFTDTAADVLMVNTAHRKRGAAAGSADLAHVQASYLQAATRALARAQAQVRFLQVHGFSAAKHPELGTAGVVASQGTAAGVHDARFSALVAGLRDALGPAAVLVYGRDAETLGATTNVQGRFLNAYTDDTFYHLELSRELRARLRDDPSQRAAFARAVTAIDAPKGDTPR